MQFSARGLPKGLNLDSATGILTGSLPGKGEYLLQLRAKNSQGSAERAFRIVVGDTLALTPPMGWSSWYSAYANISDAWVRAQADAMVASGLADHGYSYINIDDGWNLKPGEGQPATRDAQGNMKPNDHFPDMPALTAYLHARGLKAGIYTSPGPLTCGGYEGSYQHEAQDVRQFAAWGFDFLKYDLCSYSKLMKDSNDVGELKRVYGLMGKALAAAPRDFVYNLCEYGKGDVWEWGREVGGNFWRTTWDVGDGKDNSLWKSMEVYGFGQAGKEKWAGPGGWNDPDNILLGHIQWTGKLLPTPLTPNEQYSWMSLWSISNAPLVFGGDMTKLDDFTLNLLTNDEVIAVNQDALGRQGSPVSRTGDTEVWVKDLEDGSKAVALFNRGEHAAEVVALWKDLGLTGSQVVRDLWRQKDMGNWNGQFSSTVGRHGVRFLRLTPLRGGR